MITKFGGSSIKIGMIGSAGKQLEAYIVERGLEVRLYPTFAEAQTAFYQNEVSAIVDVPQDASGNRAIKLYLPDLDTISSLIRMVILASLLKQYENYLRKEKGIESRYTDLKGKPATSFEFVYSVLIPMPTFFPAFVAGSMSIESLMEEVENKTLQTLLCRCFRSNGMIGAKILSAIILSVAQCAAWLALLQMNGIAI